MKTYNKDQLEKISEKCYRFKDMSFLRSEGLLAVMYEEYKFITNAHGNFYIDASVSNDILTNYIHETVQKFLRKLK